MNQKSIRDKAVTLKRIILDAIEANPESGISYIPASGAPVHQAYGALYSEALQLWGRLQEAGVKRGDKVIAQLATSKAQIETFWACVLGGAVPVLLPQVTGWVRESENKRKLIAVWGSLGRPLLVVDGQQVPTFFQLARNDVLPGCHYLAFDANARPSASSSLPEAGDCTDDDLAFLQFSSGSTGMPKGVRLTHRNLVCNIRDIASVARMDRTDTVLSWMPYFHDMGLIGMHLVPLYLGINQIKMEASHFVTNPLRWLEEIDRSRATTIGCPNFGLELVLEKVVTAEVQALDLSCVRRLFNGAEPISAKVMRAFCDRLKPASFDERAMYPVYGMAEASLAITFGAPGELPRVHNLDKRALSEHGLMKEVVDEGDGVEYVDVGYPLPSIQLCIRSLDGKQCGDRMVGEIQIRGENVTSGYECDAEANSTSFTEDGWLRTGDLGFLCDKRLTVVGRVKEVIIVNGRNVMAYDIEHAARELANLKAGTVAACGLVDPATSRQRVALFIATRKKTDLWAWLSGIKISLDEYFGFPIDYVIPVTNIPKTSSGKLQRMKLADDLRSGAYGSQIEAFDDFRLMTHAKRLFIQPASELEKTIHNIWAAVLSLSANQVGIDDSFASLGGTSVKAIQVLSRVEESCKREYGFDLLMECKTIREMALFIELRAANDAVAGTVIAQENQHAAETSTKKIAIIGLALRFPGAQNAEEYWDNLINGRSSIAPVPQQRWTHDGATHYMGALDGIDLFDASFFAVSDAEATVIDPQQRIALEVAYEALEDAGYAGARLNAQRNVGVFLGASTNGYLDQVNACLSSEGADVVKKPFTMAGNLLNMIAARISHCLNLKGPALTLDTACSSSLVALHVACKELLSNNCEMAIAGGINLLLGPTAHQLFDVAGALSPDGICRAFDERANGIVPGEGIGIVILKELDQAIRDGDRIEAVIEAAHVNNDGRSIGIMAPNPQGQEELLRTAYRRAGISPEKISYVEAHGTGTPIGDPIEVRSLNRVFPVAADKRKYCALGSVKPNIGHLFAAAGIASTIKVLLAMRHGKLPPTLHFRNAHPQIGLDKTPFYIVKEATEWSCAGEARFAGVSSFGFGGTNAHLVLSDAPVVTPVRDVRHDEAHLVCLSARSAEELAQAGKRLADYLASKPETDLRNVCYTQNLGRQQFAHRRHVIAKTTSEFVTLLQQPASTVAAAASGRVQLVFLFTGQGSQYRGMGKSFYFRFPQFCKYVDHCSCIADPLLPEGRDMRSVIFDEQGADLLADTLYAQPAIFIIEYAMARFWMDLGIKPSALIGHSLGELVAACVAGVFSMESGIKLVIARALHMSRTEAGFMIAALADEDRIVKVIETHGLKVDIAAINGPEQCVVSGPISALDAVQSALAAERIASVSLPASKGYHSSLMDPVLADFATDLAAVKFSAPSIPIISNHSGNVAGAEIATSEYWLTHLRNPVRFAAGLKTALANGARCLLEVGPGNQLGNLARNQAKDKNDHAILYSLPSKGSACSSDEFVLETVGKLWEMGASIALAGLPGMAQARIVSLPTYPFNRKSYWLPRAMDSASVGTQERRLSANNAGSQQEVPDWFYRFTWRECFVHSHAAKQVDGTKWIVFDNGSELAECIAAHLNNRGAKCIRVFAGNAFEAGAASRYEINPAEQEHYGRLLKEASSDGEKVKGICYLWTVHEPCEGEPVTRRVERELSSGLSSLFRLAKALSISKTEKQRTLAVITGNVHSVAGYNSIVYPAGGGVAGLLKSVALEVRGVDIACIDVDLAAEGVNMIAACIADELDVAQRNERFVAYREGKRFAEQVMRIPVSRVAPRTTMLVKNGVYLITGGLSGIGLELADFLARRYHAHLVLVARSKLPEVAGWGAYLAAHPEQDRTAKALRRLRRLQEHAASVLVLSADIASNDDMTRVESCIAEKFGYLDGVIHCAGVLRDRLISQMTEAEWADVLRPKTLGTAMLYEHTRSLKPSALILFSSLAGVTGNVGQANHAAANSFEDAFARYAEQCGQRTLVINWGFWREVGVVSDPFFERILARQGVYPMTTELALTAFERAAALPFQQQIIANVAETFFPSAIQDDEMARVTRSASSMPITADFQTQLDAYAAAHPRVNALAAQLILQSLVTAGGISKGAAPFTLDDIETRSNALPQYRPLLHRYLAILCEDKLVVRDGDKFILPSSVTFIDIEHETQFLIQQFPFLSKPIAVLSRCLRALPQILSGARHAVATLFACGSLDDLEEIYEKLPMLRLGNLMLASALTESMARVGGRATEILEIGAGTGGLSSEVIPRAGAVGALSYLYTDVSQMFLTHAKTKFGAYEFVKTEILDVCKDLEGQLVHGRQFDVVIAANVLHATPDLRKSLGNIKKLLRPGGYLMTVETTRPSRFADCTVGLLDGWWNFTDHDIRAEYPLLEEAQWKSLLGELGFEADALAVKSPVAIAESDFSLIVARLPEKPTLASPSARGASPAAKGNAAMVHVRELASEVLISATERSTETSIGHVERTVTTAFSEALELNEIDVYTNFSELGTHSLRATQIVSSLREIFGVEIPLVSLFERPTIAQLAELIRELGAAKGVDADIVAEVFNEVHKLSDGDVAAIVA